MNTQAHFTNRIPPEWFRAPGANPRGTESSHVLIADDHAGSRLGFRTALEAAAYGVTEAEDGERALEVLRNDAADLALLDLRMPGLNGLEVLRRLREEAIDVPVVIVTAHGDILGALRGMELGAFDFVSKPVKPAALRETVLNALVRSASGGRECGQPSPTTLGGAARQYAENLAVARRALEHGHLELTEYLLGRALDLDQGSAEANALRGAVHERLGEHHAAYQAYRRALIRDTRYQPALDGMRRYCERFGLDPRNKAVNPSAE